MLRSALLFASSVAVASIACIDQPTFVLDESDPTTDTSPTAPVTGEGDDEMVRIPATTFTTPGTLAPTAPGGGKGEDKGKGKRDAGGGGGGGESGGGESGGGESGGGKRTGESDAGSPTPSGTTTTVPAFWLDTREVSAAAYASCMLSGDCTEAANGPGCTVAAGLSAHPANCVTVEQARTFCAWRGKRLVRNDEWTAAAAGATLRPYPWGVDAPAADRLNACGEGECGARKMYPASDGFTQTAPRGSFPLGRSAEGVWDLAGNVAEWVDVAAAGVARGGSFDDSDVAAVSTLSVRAIANASPTVGFRCARD